MHCCCLAVPAFAVFGQSGKADKGAFILISTEGEVRYLKQSGEQASPVKVGTAIPPSYSVETGATGKVVGLLSNGTLLTLTENTRMKVSTFEQEPFEDDGRKLADLPGEPSQSKVTLDLDFGSLVVKTKKLNKGSSFDINSPVGVAGIRGTEFQMASAPGQGVQLDVTESTVAFTPPGGGQPIPVSQGNGLSVSPSGVATQRPVNPVVATKIESTNQAATTATQEVSLGDVVMAVEKAAVESEQSNAQEGEAKGGDKEETINQGSEGTQEEEKESKQEKKSDTEQDSEQDSQNQDTNGQGETSNQSEAKQAESTPAGKSQKPAEPKAGQTRSESKVKVQQPDKSLLLENNPGLKKNQQLAKFGLSREQVEHFDRLPGDVRTFLLDESPEVVRRLLSMPGFEGSKAELFMRHDQETRQLLLTMSDGVIITLLDPEVDKVLLKESLKKINLGMVRPGKIPTSSPDNALNARAIALGARLMENENTELMEDLLEMSGGYLDNYWIEIGEVAEVLSRSIEVADFSAMPGFTAEEVWDNPFFSELANVYEQLELDGLVNGADRVTGADHLIVAENAQALGSHFSNGVEEIVLISRDSLEFRGNFQWDSQQAGDARLVVMSADKLTIPEGATLKSATSDLVVATRQDLLLNQVNLEAARNVSIRGMRDVHLNQVSIRADALATIKARRDLNVNGLTFNQDISRIVMEAQTMRLSNVNFPGLAQVRLNSLKGAIDGRYPNFGKSIPAAQQIGRVNFIENVLSGGNLLHDRPSFDLHGKNIEIGKIARP